MTKPRRPPPRSPSQTVSATGAPAGASRDAREAELPRAAPAPLIGISLITAHPGGLRRIVADHAAISVRRAAPNFVRMCVTCAEIVLGASTSRSAICLLVRPAATSCETSNSRALNGCHGSACRPRLNESVSRSAASARVVAPTVAAMVRTSSTSRAASPRRRRLAAAAARSSRAHPRSQNRRRARHDSHADSKAWCAADASPRARRTSPRPWSIAGSVPGWRGP